MSPDPMPTCALSRLSDAGDAVNRIAGEVALAQRDARAARQAGLVVVPAMPHPAPSPDAAHDGGRRRDNEGSNARETGETSWLRALR